MFLGFTSGRRGTLFSSGGAFAVSEGLSLVSVMAGKRAYSA